MTLLVLKSWKGNKRGNVSILQSVKGKEMDISVEAAERNAALMIILAR